MPFAAISWVAWMLKDSSTLVYGAIRRWRMIRAGMTEGRMASFQENKHYFIQGWEEDDVTNRMHLESSEQ